MFSSPGCQSYFFFSEMNAECVTCNAVFFHQSTLVRHKEVLKCRGTTGKPTRRSGSLEKEATKPPVAPPVAPLVAPPVALPVAPPVAPPIAPPVALPPVVVDSKANASTPVHPTSQPIVPAVVPPAPAVVAATTGNDKTVAVQADAVKPHDGGESSKPVADPVVAAQASDASKSVALAAAAATEATRYVAPAPVVSGEVAVKSWQAYCSICFQLFYTKKDCGFHMSKAHSVEVLTETSSIVMLPEPGIADFLSSFIPLI